MSYSGLVCLLLGLVALSHKTDYRICLSWLRNEPGPAAAVGRECCGKLLLASNVDSDDFCCNSGWGFLSLPKNVLDQKTGLYLGRDDAGGMDLPSFVYFSGYGYGLEHEQCVWKNRSDSGNCFLTVRTDDKSLHSALYLETDSSPSRAETGKVQLTNISYNLIIKTD